ncbi:MAG: hypothetical protein LBI76_07545 [Comamonas sp.]|uniref:hypothetical protein n=1 Tax=Comamonas sp. JUb58 TaxID=2485114 RepID=UPI001060BD4C|nr:hypothetical protein [Comamonas sp. JUb58]MDR0259646.1 hypothetical protein [Comamonas sp.]TDS78173.1 hypothetical protein EDF71_11293 [Comamonas sp. JUb58]
MPGSSYSFKSTALAVLALTASAWAQAACYTVYDGKNEVIYRSAEPPVDMSKPLHQTAGELPNGSRVVFTPDSAVCVTEVYALPGAKKLASSSANMVTDQLKMRSMISAQ